MIVDSAVYRDGARLEESMPLQEAYARACADPTAFVWLGLHEPTFKELEEAERVFGLHPLAVEDAVHAHQRPKIETYASDASTGTRGDTLFVVLITARYVDSDEVISTGELMLFIGDSFVVTVRHGQASALAETRMALESEPDRLRLGTDAVLHAVMDRVVDDYHQVLEGLDLDIDEIEAQVFAGGRNNHAERIFKLKREVLDFRRAVRPLVEPLETMGRQGGLGEYFRDVHDHVLRVAERVDAYDAILASALSANLAQVGVRQNEDMRKISAWVAILAVPTMLAGIYGMNFEHMPELEWEYGYALVIGVMIVACASLFAFFKKRGWL